MKKQRRIVSILIFLIMVLNLILPNDYAHAAFADSPASKSGVEQGVEDAVKPNEAENEVGSGAVTPEVDTSDAEAGLSGEGEKPKEEVQDTLDEADTDDSDNLIEDETTNYSTEGDPEVLSGGIYDEPISTWAFSGVEDLNKDGIIDSKDLSLVAGKYNSKRGQGNYNSESDFNGDGIIDIYDLVRVSSKSGTKGKIAIDPGHGGRDPGADGPSGLLEKDITLKVGLKVRALLESYGYTVVMTRTTDTYVSLQERCDIANNSGADLFVSIHNNSFSDPSANGTETFSYYSHDAGGQVARSIQSELVSALGLRNRGTKTSDFYVLRNTNMPAALTELAFISNPREEALLNTDDFQNKAAKAIVDGILGY